MKKIVALVALAGIASAASAVNQIDIKARIAGTTDWVDSINFVSTDGSPLNLEVAVFYNWSAANGLGFSGSTHSVTVSNWLSSLDSLSINNVVNGPADGRQGRFNFGGQNQITYTTGVDAGRIRIGASGNAGDVAAGGISIKQNTPLASSSAFDTSNPALGYRFNITIACNDTDPLTVRNMLIDAPLAKVSTSYSVYTDATTSSGTPVNQKASLLATDGVSITANWIPAPASLALLGMGGLVMGRRRR